MEVVAVAAMAAAVVAAAAVAAAEAAVADTWIGGKNRRGGEAGPRHPFFKVCLLAYF